MDSSQIDVLLESLWQAGGTDLLLTAGMPPQIRVHGELRAVPEQPVLTGEDTVALLDQTLSAEQRAGRDGRHEYDFSFSWRDNARIRGNAFVQRGLTTVALRMIPRQIPSMEQLGLPPALHEFARRHQGLVLVTGPTGSGRSSPTASTRHPKIFPEFYRGILRSAELSGQLDTVLEQLARYLERDLGARRKIKSAMLYPIMIAAMSVVTVVVLASFVLPRFKEFFAGLNADLPLPTRMLLAVTDFFGQWWWAVLAGLGMIIAAAVLALRFEPGRFGRDRLLLRLPVLGQTVRFALVERFCRILSSMVSAGVALPEALRAATDALRNLVFQRALARVGESLLEGEGLAGPLAAFGTRCTTTFRKEPTASPSRVIRISSADTR
jgi:type II secretory pathway component PulF